MSESDDLERGVWEAPYRLKGVPLLIVVDRRGDVRKHVKLTPGVDPVRAAVWCREWLDRIDPTPRLELVTDASLRPAPRPARVIDPRLYSDARSPLAKRRYFQHLARSAAAKAPPPRR
jgi:hypothetical protein